MGHVSGDEPILVRVHARNLLDDVFASKRSDCSVSLRTAMQKIAEEGRGVLVIIRQHEDNKSLAELIHHYQLEDNGIAMGDLPDRPYAVGAADWRTTGTGARILADLGVHKLKVLGTQKKYVALSGFDLEVAEHVG
jgi:3,4-dihydroxy 2-butanone 4-phosphate synthase/GTP cyclohydrolase II